MLAGAKPSRADDKIKNVGTISCREVQIIHHQFKIHSAIGSRTISPWALGQRTLGPRTKSPKYF